MSRRLLSHRGAVVLAGALAAMIPLGLATWTFGRAYHESETGRADARLAAGAQLAAGDVDAARADAARLASQAARSTKVQAALQAGRTVPPQSVKTVHWRVRVTAQPGRTRPAAAGDIVRAVEVRAGTRVVGTVTGTVRLADVARDIGTRTSLETHVVRRLGVHGPVGTAADVGIGGTRYRAFVLAAAGDRLIALVVPQAAITHAVARRQLVTLMAGASTLAAIAGVILLLPRRRRTPDSPDGRRERNAVALVGDVAVAAHDPDALLPVLLETAVVATDAVGGRVVWNGDELASIGEPSGPELVLALDDDTGAARLVLYPANNVFSPRDLEILEALVAQGRIALENARLHGIVRRQAQTDELTDLANRRRFMETLHYEVARSHRFGSALSLVLFDLDRFKRINDRCGHQVGDAVLRDTAETIRERVRETDLAARVGGEEFAVILPGTELDGALAFAEDLRSDIERRVRVDRVGWPVTASFGVAHASGGAAVDDLIAAADRALYRAKAAGRNAVRVADASSVT